ncbi:ribonuclease H-like domain-containing protein [Mycena galericulata]|nr:ribonuclease H-like domain-containing protein [Mycena galericulata]
MMYPCECCGGTAVPESKEELPAYKPDRVFRYIANVYEADNALRRIYKGKVGFDSEFITEDAAEAVQVTLTRSNEEGHHETVHIGRTSKYENDSETEGTYDGIDWVSAKLCIVQVAVATCVYIIDVKRMRGFPRELRRIIEDKTIAKVGVGFINDGRVIWDATGVNAKNFVDVGLMAKYGDPERYREEDAQGLSLERCVKDILGCKIDKTHRTTWRWDQNLSPAHLTYAGLDAQASLEVEWVE